MLIGLGLLGLMMLLMVVRVPIAATMLIPGFIGYWLLASPEALLAHLKGVAFEIGRASCRERVLVQV